jgi:putative thioredoxin
MNYDISDFEKEVIEESFRIPVLVDFWAEWCGPCKILGPVLERLAEKHRGEWKLAKLNTDNYQEIAAEYGIRSIPNVKLFIDGEVANEFVGALPEHMVEEWLKKAIPGKNHSLISEAKALIENGNQAKAEKILEKILKENPNEPEANVLLAKIYLFKDTDKSIQLLLNINKSPETTELIEAIETISTLLTKLKSKSLVFDSPENERYIDAINDLRNENFDSALNKLIEIIRNDRKLDDDGARKACIAIFKYLGEENEITLKHRRDFGSALYI